MPQNWFSLFLMASLGVCSFRAIGLILAAVTNTMQEATIAIQLLYMPMLFLSGATIPAAMLPNWAQTLAQFMPASYLVQRLPGHLLPQSEPLGQRCRPSARCCSPSCSVSSSPMQLFRWEKEEKIRAAQQALGAGRAGALRRDGLRAAHTARSISARTQALFRDLQRSGVFLIRNTRIFIGDGKVIENGSVLVRDGKIASHLRRARRPIPKTPAPRSSKAPARRCCPA